MEGEGERTSGGGYAGAGAVSVLEMESSVGGGRPKFKKAQGK